MSDKSNGEMSLDEVLSSIKQMVIDEDPPVLDLTDMISENGNVVKIDKNEISKQQTNVSTEMSSFLKLIHDNEVETQDTTGSGSKLNETNSYNKCENKSQSHNANYSNNQDVLYNFMKTLLEPMMQKWVDTNMPKIAGDILEKEIRNILNNLRK